MFCVSKHYGFYPSFIADIEKQAFFKEVKPLEEVLRETLIRDYGEGNLKNVKRATENFKGRERAHMEVKTTLLRVEYQNSHLQRG